MGDAYGEKCGDSNESGRTGAFLRDVTIFDNVLKGTAEYLERKHLEDFQDSSVGSTFDLSSQKKAMERGKRQRRKSSSKVLELESFATERNLYDALKDNKFKGFQDALLDSRGRYYFKRYACKHRNEENVLFWLQAQSFREGNFSKPVDGSLLLPKPSDTASTMMIKRSKRIVRKFIKVGSPLEINISHKLREKVMKAVDEEKVNTEVFGEAQREVTQMLSGFWTKFLKAQDGKIMTQKKAEKDYMKTLSEAKRNSSKKK